MHHSGEKSSERYDGPGTQNRPGMGALTVFLAITFGLAWSIIGAYLAFPEAMASVFGVLTGAHPLFFLAVYSPAIGAAVCVLWASGPGGLRRFLGRALIWRCSVGWYVFLLIGVPLVFLAGSAIRGNLVSEWFPFPTLSAGLWAVLLAMIKGPVEEFGWRGLALPLLQRKWSPFWASLLLGGIWGVWHFPAFLLSGAPQSQWSFGVFFLGCLAISFIATALFNQSKGSILLTAVFHFSLMNPIFPDAQPYDTYLLLVIALAVVGWHRETFFQGKGAVRTVIPEGPSVQH